MLKLPRKRLGGDVQIIYADNDSITQSQQILNVIQSRSDSHSLTESFSSPWVELPCRRWLAPRRPQASDGWS